MYNSEIFFVEKKKISSSWCMIQVQVCNKNIDDYTERDIKKCRS